MSIKSQHKWLFARAVVTDAFAFNQEYVMCKALTGFSSTILENNNITTYKKMKRKKKKTQISLSLSCPPGWLALWLIEPIWGHDKNWSSYKMYFSKETSALLWIYDNVKILKVFILWLLGWFHLLVTYKWAIIAIGRQAMLEGTNTNIISFPAHKHLKWLIKLPQYFSISDKCRRKRPPMLGFCVPFGSKW